MDAIFITLIILFLIFSFIKRYYKKKLHRVYRLYQGNELDGFLSEYINLYFPIPYKSSDPEFYKLESSDFLAKRFKIMRLIQFISFGLIVLWIIIMINIDF